MKLYELAFVCWIYKTLSGDDSRVISLRKATGGQVDPHNPEHQRVLFKWLNQWGCRQFSKAHQVTIAARSLSAWASTWLTALPADDVTLETIGQTQIVGMGAAYDDLRRRQAGARTLQDGSPSYVSFGPVGAAKTLFGLRPNICPPWDGYTIAALGLDHSGVSYCKYLRLVISDLQTASIQAGVKISELPALVGRAKSTPPKLIDEYYWTTITKGFTPPPRETLARWFAWASLE
jgi:hypothetical protein